MTLFIYSSTKRNPALFQFMLTISQTLLQEKRKKGVFMWSFLHQKWRKKLHRQGKPTIFIRLRRKFTMIIFQRKREGLSFV